MSKRNTFKSSTVMVKGAFDSKANPFVTGTDNLLFIQGAHFDEHGALTKWNGIVRDGSKLQQSGVDSIFTGMFPFSPTGQTATKIATTTKGLFLWGAPVAGQWNLITETSLTARNSAYTDLASGFMYNNIFYLCDGTSNNCKIYRNGTTGATSAWKWGIDAPGSAPTAADGGGGALSGSYTWKVSFVNSVTGEESNLGTVSNTLAITSKQASLTGVPVSTDGQVNERRIYRTAASGTAWLYVGKISDNTTTTFTDNVADSALGIAGELSKYSPPPTLLDAEVWRGYCFSIAPNSSLVYIHQYNMPHGVDLTVGYRGLDVNDGDSCVAVKRLYSNMIAYKGNSIWVSTGDSADTFGFTRTVTGTGAVNKQSILQTPDENTHIFLGKNGYFYKFNGARVEPVNIGMQKWLNDNMVRTLAHKTVGFTWPKRNLMCWLIAAEGSTTKNYIVLHDYVTNQWGLRKLHGFSTNVGTLATETDGELKFYLGGTTGYTHTIGDGYADDDGDAIVFDVTDRGHPQGADAETSTARKSFTAIHVFFAPQNGLTLELLYRIDTPEGDYTSMGTIDCSNPSGTESLSLHAVGRRLFIKFKNEQTGPALAIRGWQVEYKVLGRSSNA